MSILTRFYEPFFSFYEVDDLVNEAFKTQCNARSNAALEKYNETRVLKPRMNLHENPEANTITATFELPGLTKDNVSIDVHNNNLTISGEMSEVTQRNVDGYVIKERRSGKFSRSVALPNDTKPESIKASMENGILTVTFPKSSPGQETHRITIS